MPRKRRVLTPAEKRKLIVGEHATKLAETAHAASKKKAVRARRDLAANRITQAQYTNRIMNNFQNNYQPYLARRYRKNLPKERLETAEQAKEHFQSLTANVSYAPRVNSDHGYKRLAGHGKVECPSCGHKHNVGSTKYYAHKLNETMNI